MTALLLCAATLQPTVTYQRAPFAEDAPPPATNFDLAALNDFAHVQRPARPSENLLWDMAMLPARPGERRPGHAGGPAPADTGVAAGVEVAEREATPVPEPPTEEALDALAGGPHLAPAAVPGDARAIPGVALAAYQNAERLAGGIAPGCEVRWPILAGIGRIESVHGIGYGTASSNGDLSRTIIGPPLNGSSGTARILDTDNGLWDDDEVYDRAVGPMQFIPSSWRRFGRDGNGDGLADPHNFFDAALGAAAHLCLSAPGDYSDRTRLARALFRYNRSMSYVLNVLYWIDAYGRSQTEDAPLLAALPAPTPSKQVPPPRPARPAEAPSVSQPAPSPALPAASEPGGEPTEPPPTEPPGSTESPEPTSAPEPSASPPPPEPPTATESPIPEPPESEPTDPAGPLVVLADDVALGAVLRTWRPACRPDPVADVAVRARDAYNASDESTLRNLLDPIDGTSDVVSSVLERRTASGEQELLTVRLSPADDAVSAVLVELLTAPADATATQAATLWATLTIDCADGDVTDWSWPDDDPAADESTPEPTEPTAGEPTGPEVAEPSEPTGREATAPEPATTEPAPEPATTEPATPEASAPPEEPAHSGPSVLLPEGTTAEGVADAWPSACQIDPVRTVATDLIAAYSTGDADLLGEGLAAVDNSGALVEALLDKHAEAGPVALEAVRLTPADDAISSLTMELLRPGVEASEPVLWATLDVDCSSGGVVGWSWPEVENATGPADGLGHTPEPRAEETA